MKLIPFICWLIIIYILTTVRINIQIPFEHADKVVHFGMFSVMSFLGTYIIAELTINLIIGLSLGILAETNQLHIIYRSFDWKDMICNCLGVVITLFFLFKIKRIANKSPLVIP